MLAAVHDAETRIVARALAGDRHHPPRPPPSTTSNARCSTPVASFSATASSTDPAPTFLTHSPRSPA